MLVLVPPEGDILMMRRLLFQRDFGHFAGIPRVPEKITYKTCTHFIFAEKINQRQFCRRGFEID